MSKLKIFYTILFLIILITFTLNAKAHNFEAVHNGDPQAEAIVKEPTALYMAEFDKQMAEVRLFFKEVTGQDTSTQVSDVRNFPNTSQVVAYCMPTTRDTPSFLAFNHKLLQTMPEDIFQVILHEFTHCEYGIGHLQIGGSFMNDGGNPSLPIEKVKKQFVIFHKFYMDNYKAMR